MNMMFPPIILVILTISSTLVRARLVDHDVLVTEESAGIPDTSSLETLDSSTDKNRDTETISEDPDDTISRLTAKLNELEDKFKTFEALQKSPASNDLMDYKRTVAFHAVSDHGIISHLGVNQKIVFGSVLLNMGNGYNNHHGIFTAPIAGLYMFSSSMLSANGAHNALFAADIIVNGAVHARLYGKGFHGFHAQGSNTIVAKLNKGDTVAVRLACCANSGMYGGRYSSFSGVLLNGCAS